MMILSILCQLLMMSGLQQQQGISQPLTSQLQMLKMVLFRGSCGTMTQFEIM